MDIIRLLHANFKGCFPTISLSVSVFVKQWPFIRGLDGSLSDSTITSSGDGGCLSFFMTLWGKKDNTENAFHHYQSGITTVTANLVQFGLKSSRWQDIIVISSALL